MKPILSIAIILSLVGCATNFYPEPGEAFMSYKAPPSQKSTQAAPVLKLNPNLYSNEF